MTKEKVQEYCLTCLSFAGFLHVHCSDQARVDVRRWSFSAYCKAFPGSTCCTKKHIRGIPVWIKED